MSSVGMYVSPTNRKRFPEAGEFSSAMLLFAEVFEKI